MILLWDYLKLKLVFGEIKFPDYVGILKILQEYNDNLLVVRTLLPTQDNPFSISFT